MHRQLVSCHTMLEGIQYQHLQGFLPTLTLGMHSFASMACYARNSLLRVGVYYNRIDSNGCCSCTGVRWSSYGENPHLQKFFKVLSLSADRDERIYISTIEAHKVMCRTALHPLLHTTVYMTTVLMALQQQHQHA